MYKQENPSLMHKIWRGIKDAAFILNPFAKDIYNKYHEDLIARGSRHLKDLEKYNLDHEIGENMAKNRSASFSLYNRVTKLGGKVLGSINPPATPGSRTHMDGAIKTI